MKNSFLKETFFPIIREIEKNEGRNFVVQTEIPKKQNKVNNKELYNHKDLSKITTINDKLRQLIEGNNQFAKDVLLDGISPFLREISMEQKKTQKILGTRFIYIDFPEDLVSNNLFFEEPENKKGISLKKIYYMEKAYGMNRIPINYFINEVLYKTMFPWIIQDNTILLVRTGKTLNGMSLEYMNMPWWKRKENPSSAFSSYHSFFDRCVPIFYWVRLDNEYPTLIDNVTTNIDCWSLLWNSKMYTTDMIQEIFAENTLPYNQTLATNEKDEGLVLQFLRELITDLFSYLPIKYDLFGSIMKKTIKRNEIDDFQVIPQHIMNRILSCGLNDRIISGNTKEILQQYYEFDIYKTIKGGTIAW